MTDDQMPEYRIEIKPQDPVFVISVVSEMVGIPVWTLRKLDEMGVVCPERLGKKTRCYSHVQIQQLSYIHFLMEKKKVNISGIKVILEIEEES